jgi:hypothetical protein
MLYDDEPPPRRWQWRLLLIPCGLAALLLPWLIVALVFWARSQHD